MSMSSSSNSLPYSADGGGYSTHDTLALLVIGFTVTAVCVIIIVLCDCLCCRPRHGVQIVYMGPGAGHAAPFLVRRDGGLGSAAVAALPSFQYRRDAAVGGQHGDQDGREEEGSGSARGGWAQCAVCLSVVKEGDVVRQLPACTHLFHVGCIDAWLHCHSTCPLCRATVEAPCKDHQLPENLV